MRGLVVHEKMQKQRVKGYMGLSSASNNKLTVHIENRKKIIGIILSLTCTVLAPRSRNSAASFPVSTPPIAESERSLSAKSLFII